MKRERPTTPASYGISTEPEGMLSWDWASQRLEQSRNYWLVSTRPDGRPHAMPVWGLWREQAFWFGTDVNSVKGRNMEHNSEVVVHLESGDETVVVEGTVSRVGDTALLEAVLDAYQAKYDIRPGIGPESCFCKVAPARVLAWSEAGFPRTATRFRF